MPAFLPARAPSAPAGPPKSSKDAPLGRSHRAKIGKAKLKLAIDLTREVLGVPADYRIGITPGLRYGRGRNGALVAARRARRRRARLGELRRRLGRRRRQGAQAQGRRTLKAAYGELPDLAAVNFDNDVVFAWNGTTSGVRVSERRLDRGRPQGPDDLRRDLGRLRPGSRLGEARRGHLLLAEGARRRGGAWHDHSLPARRRAAGDLHARRGRCRRSSDSPRAAS